MKNLLAAALAGFVALLDSHPARDSHGQILRSHAAVAAFKRTHACPGTGVKGVKPCPGFVVDHVIPLCAGGQDSTANMQWQSYTDSLKKDKLERAQCADLRKHPLTQ